MGCTEGFAITTDCGEIQIKEVDGLARQVWFIDTLADLLDKSKSPDITVSLFESKDMPSFGVVITPQDVSELSTRQVQKTFLFKLSLSVNETVTVKAYGKLLKLTEIIINMLEVMEKRLSLTFGKTFAIINSNSATLTVRFNKQ